jgi:hypothetical protein
LLRWRCGGRKNSSASRARYWPLLQRDLRWGWYQLHD